MAKRRVYKQSRKLSARHQFTRHKNERGRQAKFNARVVARLLLYTFFIVSLLWFFYFFIVSGNFEIKIINITGIANIPESEIKQIIHKKLGEKRWLILPNKNIFVFSKAELREAVNQKYIVENIVIEKKLPFTLNISIDEKLARLVLRVLNEIIVNEDPKQEAIAADHSQGADETNEEQKNEARESTQPLHNTTLFYIDVNGIVVSQEKNIPEELLAALPVIEIKLDSQTLVKPGDIILSRERIDYIFSIYDEISKSEAGIQVDYLLYDPEVKDEFKIVTKEGWQIFLNGKLSVQTQIKKIELALEEKIKNARASLRYVDLRVNDRVYYK